MNDTRDVPDLTGLMGDDSEKWSREFAKRFALLNADGHFVDTLEIMRAWFYGQRAAVLEQVLSDHARSIAHVNALEQQVRTLQRAFDDRQQDKPK